MPSIWQSFLPYHVATDLLENPGKSPLERESRFNAVTLFADVSGFTTLSEALGKRGKDGTEELTLLLNQYFSTIVSILKNYGGIIGKFGGDAITAFFPIVTGSEGATGERAIHCALEMQEQMENYANIQTAAGIYSISMKVGLAAGPIYFTTVGDQNIHLEHILAGNALDLCAEAEHYASQGEIVAHISLTKMLPAIEGQSLEDDFFLIKRISPKVDPAPLPELEPFSDRISDLASRYIHPSIAQRIRQEQLSFLNEHRKVTVLFGSFIGFDYDHDPELKDKLQAYLLRVIQTVEKYDGYLNKVNMGDKGSKFIILFGAPIAHENDIERALRCALELSALPDASLKVGANTGFVFCGQIGSEDRREYTVMGDAVNLAARLMQAAHPGQILISENTYQESASRFAWETSLQLQVKGKSETIRAYPIRSILHSDNSQLQASQYSLPMVGRQAELTLASEKISNALEGNGQIIGIQAKAGMGKSRLAAEIIRIAAEAGISVFGSECLSHGTQTSYAVWRNILRGILGISTSLELPEQIENLHTALEKIQPSFVPRAPLLSLAMNISIPDNELTKGMDAKLRKESLEALIITSILHFASQGPVQLVFEDYHWIDPLSLDLLDNLERNIGNSPIIILKIYRPTLPDGYSIQASAQNYASEIHLKTFTPAEVNELINLKLDQLYGVKKQLNPALVRQITERAQGNPFYIDEMLNLIHDLGMEPEQLQTLESIDLPDSLNSLVLSRIDRLTEAAKTTLKVASVIGRTFQEKWLWGIYPKLGTPERVKEQLKELISLDVRPLNITDPELEYVFRHIVTQDVAYESLALSTRTQLHNLTGAYIEKNFPEEIPRFLDLLAYHYSLGKNLEKQRKYLLEAGQAAQDAYANQAAIDHYQNLLEILPEKEQSSVLVQLSQVFLLIGEWDQSANSARQALKIAKKYQLTTDIGKSLQAFGTVCRVQGRYDDALENLMAALAQFTDQQDISGVIDVNNTLGLVYWNQGKLEEALSCFEKCKQLSSQIDSPLGTYRAASNIGLIYWYQGNSQKALINFQEGKEIAESIHNTYGLGRIIGNMGNVYLDEGDFALAFECHSQFLQSATELGDQEGISIAGGNLGNVYVEQGEYDNALACYQFNLQIAQTMGDPIGVGMALWYLGYTLVELQQYPQALEYLDKAIQAARNLDIPYELSDFLHTKADCLSRQGNHAVALDCAQKALQIAREVDNDITVFRARVLEIQLRHTLKIIDIPTTIAEFENLIQEHQDGARDDTEQAAVAYAIWQLDPEQENKRTLAAELYKQLYKGSPNIQYKRRYEKITEAKLPDPPPLPDLPEIIRETEIDIEKLLKQI